MACLSHIETRTNQTKEKKEETQELGLSSCVSPLGASGVRRDLTNVHIVFRSGCIVLTLQSMDRFVWEAIQ